MSGGDAFPVVEFAGVVVIAESQNPQGRAWRVFWPDGSTLTRSLASEALGVVRDRERAAAARLAPGEVGRLLGVEWHPRTDVGEAIVAALCWVKRSPL